MKRILVAFFALLALLWFGISFAGAQSASLAPANVPHLPSDCPPVTVCPPTATPAPGSQGGHSGDPDGDGIPNGIDQCPNEGGPSSNQGCPPGVDRSITTGSGATVGQVTPSFPGILLPLLPTSHKECVLATRTAEPVNVRNKPSLHSDIIGTLDPKLLYSPDSSLETLDGSTWYAILQPFGWVAASAVRVSAGCPYVLPAYKERPITDQNPLPLSYVNAPHIVLDKGDGSGEDTPQGYCAPSFALDMTAADGSMNTIHFSFGDGSVQPTPERGCITLNTDGHSFVIEPPPDPDKPSFPTPWSIGYLNGELTFLTFLPSNPGEQPPGIPTKPGVTLAWSLYAPPCDTGDQSCHAPGALNFLIDFSVENPNTRGVAIDWTVNFDGSSQATGKVPPVGPPSPDGAESQGIVIDWGLYASGPPIDQPFSIDFFPNGFDPSIGGFTQVENQPGGSSPGDKYGFTQIENQPGGGQIAIEFALPAVQ